MSIVFLLFLSCISCTTAYTCDYKFYNLSSLTSNVDLVGRVAPPPGSGGVTCYVYLNPCGTVNNPVGSSSGASAWGLCPNGFFSTLIFGTQDSQINTSFVDNQDPASGMLQTYQGPNQVGYCFEGTSITSVMNTQISYICALSTPDYIPSTVLYDQSSQSCSPIITVPTPVACTLPKPILPCIFNIQGSTFDLSLLHGIDRLGIGTMDSNFSYYMNLCGPITHTSISTDMDATIVQFYGDAQSYHATLATIKQPLEWNLINGSDATLGIRAITTLSDHACSQRTTTINLLCDMSDNKTPLWYVDRSRRTMTIQETDSCTVSITFKARNACPTSVPPPVKDDIKEELMEQ